MELYGLDMMDLASWTITIITALSLRKQLKQNKEFNKQTYEMQRRVNAANTLFQWSINSKVEETIAKRVVEKFSEDQVRKLLNEESFKIKKEHYEKISFILRNANIDIKNDICSYDSSVLVVSCKRCLIINAKIA